MQLAGRFFVFGFFVVLFFNRKWWLGSSVCEICVVEDFLVGERGTDRMTE